MIGRFNAGTSWSCLKCSVEQVVRGKRSLAIFDDSLQYKLSRLLFFVCWWFARLYPLPTRTFFIANLFEPEPAALVSFVHKDNDCTHPALGWLRLNLFRPDFTMCGHDTSGKPRGGAIAVLNSSMTSPQTCGWCAELTFHTPGRPGSPLATHARLTSVGGEDLTDFTKTSVLIQSVTVSSLVY